MVNYKQCLLKKLAYLRRGIEAWDVCLIKLVFGVHAKNTGFADKA